MSASLLRVSKSACALIGLILSAAPYFAGAQSKTSINKAPDAVTAKTTDVKPELVAHHKVAAGKKGHIKKHHAITNPSNDDKKLKEIKAEKNREKNNIHTGK